MRRLPIDNIRSSGLQSGTNSGVKASILPYYNINHSPYYLNCDPMPSGKNLLITRLNGSSDKDTFVEIRATILGNVQVTVDSVEIIGIGTLFTQYLKVGDYIRVGLTNELKKVVTITDDTNLTVDLPIIFDMGSSTLEVILEKFSVLANTPIELNNIDCIEGFRNLPVHAFITDSTANCFLTLYAGYFS